METVDQRQISIEAIKKQLSKCANNPPQADPFSRAGRQAWSEWSEACREIEGELRAEGEYF